MSKKWIVGEETNVNEYLERKKDEIKVGDTIEYISNNQMGWKLYEVVLDNEGKKSLKVKSDYDSMMSEFDEEPEPVTKTGGKKRRRSSKKKSKRRRGKNRKTKSKK
jgi:hypothetical protein